MLEFNVYDMLVFEDEDGSIYQDCVCSIERNAVFAACDENEEDEYFTDIVCNNFTISLDSLGSIYSIETNSDGISVQKYKLKEIWTRVNEDTYKKVWSK